MSISTRTLERAQPALRLYREALRLSREHGDLSAQLLVRHGDHGPLISGVIRDHFPDADKDALRGLCRAMNAKAEEAWAARPPRVRVATMRRLFDLLRAECGSGRYL